MRNKDTQKLLEQMDKAIKELQKIRNKHSNLVKPLNQSQNFEKQAIRQDYSQNSNRFLSI